jgi:hypothetical protein
MRFTVQTQDLWVIAYACGYVHMYMPLKNVNLSIVRTGSEKGQNNVRTRSEQGQNKFRTISEQGQNNVRTMLIKCL